MIDISVFPIEQWIELIARHYGTSKIVAQGIFHHIRIGILDEFSIDHNLYFTYITEKYIKDGNEEATQLIDEYCKERKHYAYISQFDENGIVYSEIYASYIDFILRNKEKFERYFPVALDDEREYLMCLYADYELQDKTLLRSWYKEITGRNIDDDYSDEVQPP